MKKIFIIVLVLVVGLSVSSCKKMDSQIIGTWTWTSVQDSNGNDLVETSNYETIIFNDDGTYNSVIGSASYTGIYSVNNDEETIIIDGVVWDINKLSKSSFILKSRDDFWFEWHLEK